MINLPDRNARRREWLAKRRLQHGFSRAAVPRLKSEFHRVAKAASELYAKEQSIDPALREHVENLTKIVAPTLVATAMAFGQRAQRMLKKAEVQFVETKDTEEELQARVAIFAKTRSRTAMARVANTTKKQINRAIEQGIKDGDSRDDIAQDIVDRTGGLVGEARARVIADTEVHSAANAGELESIKLLDVPLKKEWMSMNDELVRDDHAEANGEEVSLDDSFEVGSDKLAYPGDPAAPPSQTVNCRCIMVYNESKKG